MKSNKRLINFALKYFSFFWKLWDSVISGLPVLKQCGTAGSLGLSLLRRDSWRRRSNWDQFPGRIPYTGGLQSRAFFLMKWVLSEFCLLRKWSDLFQIRLLTEKVSEQAEQSQERMVQFSVPTWQVISHTDHLLCQTSLHWSTELFWLTGDGIF